MASDARCERLAKVLEGWRRTPTTPAGAAAQPLSRLVGGPGIGAGDPSSAASRVERVVERVAAKFECNQRFRRYPPCCLCR